MMDAKFKISDVLAQHEAVDLERKHERLLQLYEFTKTLNEMMDVHGTKEVQESNYRRLIIDSFCEFNILISQHKEQLATLMGEEGVKKIVEECEAVQKLFMSDYGPRMETLEGGTWYYM